MTTVKFLKHQQGNIRKMSKEWYEYVPFENVEDREGASVCVCGGGRNFKEDFLKEEDFGIGRGIMHRG